jgi:hypothetical protein
MKSSFKTTINVWGKPAIIFWFSGLGVAVFNFFIKKYYTSQIDDSLLDFINLFLMGTLMLCFMWTVFFRFDKIDYKPPKTTKLCLILFTFMYLVGIACGLLVLLHQV